MLHSLLVWWHHGYITFGLLVGQVNTCPYCMGVYSANWLKGKGQVARSFYSIHRKKAQQMQRGLWNHAVHGIYMNIVALKEVLLAFIMYWKSSDPNKIDSNVANRIKVLSLLTIRRQITNKSYLADFKIWMNNTVGIVRLRWIWLNIREWWAYLCKGIIFWVPCVYTYSMLQYMYFHMLYVSNGLCSMGWKWYINFFF